MMITSMFIAFIITTSSCFSFYQRPQYKILKKSSSLSFEALDVISPVFQNQNLFISNIEAGSIFSTALRKAFDGGVAGASAAVIQVLSLMWLRTALNYQYRYGMNTSNALKTLYKEGGIPRLYQGLPFALLQGPLSRFGDTASNALVASAFEQFDPTGSVFPLFVRTGMGSITAGAWRIIILPIDTCKTCLQVNGANGLKELKQRIDVEGYNILYNGAIAASAATVVGHFPWFLTYNYLSTNLITPSDFIASIQQIDVVLPGDIDLNSFIRSIDIRFLEVLRSAFIGLCASSLSDVSSNSFRVLKTYRQTYSDDTLSDGVAEKEVFSYLTAAKLIVKEEGLGGLLGRGLQTRLLANALQGMLFSVLFKYFQKK